MAPIPASTHGSSAVAGLFDNAPTYEVGESFTYTLDQDYDRSVFHNEQLTVTITHTFAPFTCSPVMRVRYDTRQGLKSAILKTYDRRAGTVSRKHPRNNKTVLQLRPKDDMAFARLVQKGKMQKLCKRFEAYHIPRRRSGLMEAYFQWRRAHEFRSEVLAYKRMSHLQGRLVPRFLASMFWHPDGPRGSQLGMGAILIEEVENASTLHQFLKQPRSIISRDLRTKIKRECDNVQQEIAQAGVVDPDRHSGNALIVMHDLASEDFRIVQIDFGFATSWTSARNAGDEDDSDALPAEEDSEMQEGSRTRKRPRVTEASGASAPDQEYGDGPRKIKKIKLNLPAHLQ